MKEIIVIQHTQSIHHTNGMIGSWFDWELSELGKTQAHLIGKKLSIELKDKGYVMYTSDLLRTKQTAEIISTYLNTTPILKQELRERNLGSACGQSIAWLKEHQYPYQDHIDHKALDDVETRRELWNRIIPFYQEIIHSKENKIIIVSHGDALSVFFAMFLGLPAEYLNHMDLFGLAGGVSFLYINDEHKHIIKRLSDMQYIQ